MKEMDELLAARVREAALDGLLYVPCNKSERGAVLTRVNNHTLVRPFRGMYDLREHWEELSWKDKVRLTLRTYAAIHPECIFCSFSAAFLQGLWVPKREVLGHVHIVGANGNTWGEICRHSIKEPMEASAEGLRVTSLERTAFDCMRGLDFRNGLAVADSYLRVAGASREGAIERVNGLFSGSQGIVKVRDLLPHADARSESGGESYARAVMIENRVLLPELQVSVPRPDDPGRTYRFDYWWELPDGRLVDGELDGKGKMTEPEMLGDQTMEEAFRAERMRESMITSLGIEVMRFTFPMAAKVYPLLELIDLYRIPRIGGPLPEEVRAWTQQIALLQDEKRSPFCDVGRIWW